MKSEANSAVNASSATFRVRSSQISAAPPSDRGNLTGRRGVPLAVPLPFLLTGAGAAALFGLLAPLVLPLALQAPGFPHVLALVHIVTLGWLTMMIMGASFQL